MRTPEGREVFINPLRPGCFHFRCGNLELVLRIHSDGKSSIHYSNQDSEEIPVFDDWRAAEKAAFEIFDQARKKQHKTQKKR